MKHNAYSIAQQRIVVYNVSVLILICVDLTHLSRLIRPPIYLYNTIVIMKKVWTYKRADIKGWWVGWYESGIRKAKALPSKELSEHFKRIKYTQLNSDVFTGIYECRFCIEKCRGAIAGW